MRFAIEQLTENGLPIVRLKDTTGAAITDILPEYGALLHRWQVPLNGRHYNVIDNYADADTLKAKLSLSYKSAKLSPFVCRTAGGKFEWLGKMLEFRNKFPDGSAIHGLLYNQPFALVDSFVDDQQASVRLRHHYRATDPGYPFTYNCEVQYRLAAGCRLQLETSVLNLSETPIPLADGWHPYFQLNGKIDDCELQMHTRQRLEFNEALVPTGAILPDDRFRQPRKLNGLELDNCFVLDAPDGGPCCRFYNPANGLNLYIVTDETYPYLQVYTPPHRNSIAIENLSGAPDCLNNGIGITLLGPGESASFSTWYKIDTAKND